jgi:hypothetical protein
VRNGRAAAITSADLRDAPRNDDLTMFRYPGISAAVLVICPRSAIAGFFRHRHGSVQI